jgi:hypothetical protein
MKLDKNDRVEYAAVTGEDGAFTFEEKQYNANAVDAGKRATRGKRLT